MCKQGIHKHKKTAHTHTHTHEQQYNVQVYLGTHDFCGALVRNYPVSKLEIQHIRTTRWKIDVAANLTNKQTKKQRNKNTNRGRKEGRQTKYTYIHTIICLKSEYCTSCNTPSEQNN